MRFGRNVSQARQITDTRNLVKVDADAHGVGRVQDGRRRIEVRLYVDHSQKTDPVKRAVDEWDKDRPGERNLHAGCNGLSLENGWQKIEKDQCCEYDRWPVQSFHHSVLHRVYCSRDLARYAGYVLMPAPSAIEDSLLPTSLEWQRPCQLQPIRLGLGNYLIGL